MSAINTNNSNNTNGSNIPDIDTMGIAYVEYVMNTVFILFGTAINVWMLWALLSSTEIRARMRNKLICIILFNNLLKASILSALEILEITLFEEGEEEFGCNQLISFNHVVRFTLMWIENWYVLIFLAHYILSTLLDFNPMKNSSPRKLQIGTMLILLGPWVFSFIVAPSVMAYHSHKEHGIDSKGCIEVSIASLYILCDFGIVVPFFLMLVLLAVIVILYKRRITLISTTPSSMIAPNSQIDDVKAYVAICVVSVLTQILLVAMMVSYSPDGAMGLAEFMLMVISWLLNEFRCVLLSLAFLLFEDVRSRVKIWRPWYRPGPGIDLTVQYAQQKKEGVYSVTT